jgi:outer membrane translocation and assembly module TamA
LAATEVEYRFPIYKRFAGVVFAAMGSVTDRWSNGQTDYLRYTIGAGLRFALLPKDKIRLRFDVGLGKNTSAFY